MHQLHKRTKKRPSPYSAADVGKNPQAPTRKKKKTKAKKKRAKPPAKKKKLVPGGATGPLDSFFLRRFRALKKDEQGQKRYPIKKSIRLLYNEVNFCSALSDGQCDFMREQFRAAFKRLQVEGEVL